MVGRALADKVRGLAVRVLYGGLGAAGALLFPRVWSVTTQWVLAAAAGPASVTAYVSTMTRGVAAVALVANALGPVLGHRRSAMGSAGGRALVSVAMVLM